MQTLKEFVEQLPPDIQQEVRDFAEFLLAKRATQATRKKEPKRKPTFEWGGALKELRDEYTSVELQHELREWRAGKQ